MAAATEYKLNVAQAVRAQNELNKAYKRGEEAVEGVAKELTKAEKKGKRFELQADPVKKHAKKFDELADAVKKGNLSLENAEVLAKRYNNQLDRAQHGGNKAFGATQLAKLAQFAAGYASIRTAVSLVTAELEAQQKLTDKRVATQISVDQSRSIVRRNMAGATDAEIKQISQAAKDISSESGVSEVPINIALSETYSATGGDLKGSIQLVRVTTSFSPDSPANIAETAGTLADLSKVTGTTRGLENLGFLSYVGAASRIVDLKLQAANIAPALIGTLAYGGDGQTSGSLYASLTNAGGDKTGAATGTAVIALAKQLEEFDEGEKSFDSDSLRGRLEHLQNNPKLAEKFLSDASFEKRAGGIIRNLLTSPDSVSATLYRDNLKKSPTSDQLEARGQRAIDVLGVDNPLQLTAKRSRALSQAAEASALRVSAKYLSSGDRDNLDTMLLDAGQSSLKIGWGNFIDGIDGGVTPLEAKLRVDAAAHDNREQTIGGRGGFVRINHSESAHELVEHLKEFSSKLDEMIHEQKRATNALEKQGDRDPEILTREE